RVLDLVAAVVVDVEVERRGAAEGVVEPLAGSQVDAFLVELAGGQRGVLGRRPLGRRLAFVRAGGHRREPRRPQRGEQPGGPPAHSGWAPDAFTTFAHFLISLRM